MTSRLMASFGQGLGLRELNIGTHYLTNQRVPQKNFIDIRWYLLNVNNVSKSAFYQLVYIEIQLVMFLGSTNTIYSFL